jgi:hypothetical protein
VAGLELNPVFVSEGLENVMDLVPEIGLILTFVGGGQNRARYFGSRLLRDVISGDHDRR